MSKADITIKTRDGTCPASVFTPASGKGPWPGIIFFMDGLGIRQSMWDMGQRLADMGYVVLLPDLYYRNGAYPPMVPSDIFSDPKKREGLMKLVGSLNRDRKVSDAGAFIAYLDTRSDVKGKQYGSTGYCMGGNASITAAGAYPDRFAAIASFHGGNLATVDNPDSPHLYVKGIKGRVYVAGAVQDGSFDDAQKQRLETALTEAKVDHVVETYEGALHGFAVPDMPVYNKAAAERHWDALAKLYGATLTT
jgi:carboxymethylenebutenolidase